MTNTKSLPRMFFLSEIHIMRHKNTFSVCTQHAVPRHKENKGFASKCGDCSSNNEFWPKISTK